MHKCENDSLKIEGSRLKIFDGYYSDWDIYPINYCPLCGINLQPERLSPEDHIVDDNKMVSDSLNQANK